MLRPRGTGDYPMDFQTSLPCRLYLPGPGNLLFYFWVSSIHWLRQVRHVNGLVWLAFPQAIAAKIVGNGKKRHVSTPPQRILSNLTTTLPTAYGQRF